MWDDSFTKVWDTAALTADAYSSSIDLGNVTPKREVGAGEPGGFALTVDVAADNTSGNETYQFNVVQDAAADFSSAPKILASFVYLYTELVAGAMQFLPVPPRVTARYLGLGWDGGGTTPTITVTAKWIPQSFFHKVTLPAKGYSIQ